MSDRTRELLCRLDAGELLELVYGELQRLVTQSPRFSDARSSGRCT